MLNVPHQWIRDMRGPRDALCAWATECVSHENIVDFIHSGALSHAMGFTLPPLVPPAVYLPLPVIPLPSSFSLSPLSLLPLSTSSSLSPLFLHLAGIFCVNSVGCIRLDYLCGGVCAQEQLVRDSPPLHTPYRHHVAACYRLFLIQDRETFQPFK